MPDWITHLAFVYLFCVAFRLHHRDWEKLFLGALIPDAFHVFPTMLTFTTDHGIFIVDYSLRKWLWNFHEVAHSIVGIILLSVLTTSIYQAFLAKNRDGWRKTLVFVVFGAVSHLFIDSLRIPFPEIGYVIFFPFTTEKYSLGWFTPSQFMIFQLMSLPIVFMMIVHLAWQLKRESSERDVSTLTNDKETEKERGMTQDEIGKIGCSHQ